MSRLRDEPRPGVLGLPTVSDLPRLRGEGRGLRGFLRRLTPSRQAPEAELPTNPSTVGATPIAECPQRRRVRVAGMLRSVTVRPRGRAPALEAELDDGSDVVHLVWLGRRSIAGIEPGRLLVAEGLITVQDGRKTIFNPRYELRAGEGS